MDAKFGVCRSLEPRDNTLNMLNFYWAVRKKNNNEIVFLAESLYNHKTHSLAS